MSAGARAPCAGAFAFRTSRARAGHARALSERSKTAADGAVSVIGIVRAAPARVASSMFAPHVAITSTSRATFYKFTLPPGSENARTLCFDTGPLAQSDDYLWHNLPDGTRRYAPARDRMPASFAARILHSSIRGYARVLDRHAKGDYDMDVHDIGRVRGITVLFRGPNPGHEVMERMLIYVAVRPEHYDAARATHGFSFHLDRPKEALSEEISRVNTPWLTAARIRAAGENEAGTGAPHLFSAGSAENAVRGAGPGQSREAAMTEGAMKTETAADAAAPPAPRPPPVGRPTTTVVGGGGRPARAPIATRPSPSATRPPPSSPRPRCWRCSCASSARRSTPRSSRRATRSTP